jgi:acetyl-CoA C-acetyltransferase
VQKIKLKSASMTRFGKLDADYFALLIEAVRPVFEQSDPGRIERIYFSSFAPRELCGIRDPAPAVLDTLKKNYPQIDAPILGPYITGGEALYAALETSAALSSDTLVLACEKMTHVDAGTAAGLLAPRVNPVEKLYGATLPALGALASLAYMQSFAVPYTAFHRVAVKNHRNGALNPRAHFQKEITVEEVASSPFVSDPLRRHHCAPISDGAVACVLGAEGGGIVFRGWGKGTDERLFHERSHIGRFRAAAAAGNAAFRAAGARPSDVDVVEIHDAFSPFELINLEELGFYTMGEGWRALDNGELEINGRVAVNPSGGMKARGHPIGVCGLSSVVEIHTQLTCTAGERQRKPARLGLIQSAGGVARDSYVFLLGLE